MQLAKREYTYMMIQIAPSLMVNAQAEQGQGSGAAPRSRREPMGSRGRGVLPHRHDGDLHAARLPRRPVRRADELQPVLRCDFKEAGRHIEPSSAAAQDGRSAMRCLTSAACILTVLVFAPFLASGQEPPTEIKRQTVDVYYDRFKDVTTTSVTLVVKEAGSEPKEPARIFVEVGFTHRGRKITRRPRTFYISIKYFGELRFDRLNTFIALADGQRVRLGQLTRTRVGLHREELDGEIAAAALTKIANAKMVEVQVGGVEFGLGRGDLETLRELVKRASP